jgi:hypothetical protein
MLISFFKKNALYIAGALLGGVAGFFYWQQIGCVSGTCAITSNPYNSTLYGALMGSLAFNLFKKEQVKHDPTPTEQ